MDLLKKSLLSFIFLIIFVVIANNAFNNFFIKKSLEIQILSPRNSDTWQVFYGLGKDYRERDSSKVQVNKARGETKIVLDLYYLKIHKLRVDPGTHIGDILIKSIVYRIGSSRNIWSAKQIAKEFKPLNQISRFAEENGLLRIKSTGQDPFFEYSGDFGKIDDSTGNKYEFARILLFLAGVFLAIGLFVYFEKLLHYAYKVESLIRSQRNVQVWLISAFIFIVCVFVGNAVVDRLILAKTLLIRVESPRHFDSWQIFYDVGNGLNETDSVKAQIYGKNGSEEIVFRLPPKRIQNLRIDPGSQAGEIIIREIRFKIGQFEHIWTANDIVNDFKPLNDIAVFIVKNGALYMKISGNDPFFMATFDVGKFSDQSSLLIRGLILKALLYFLLLLILVFLNRTRGFNGAVLKYVFADENWNWLFLVFSVFILIRMVLFFYNFYSPVADHHSFRQTQNLMTIRDYYLGGINLLLPRVDMFGSPGFNILEFPIYQALVAFLYLLFSPLEIYGRILNIIFTVLAGLFLFLVSGKLFNRKIALFSVLFFLFSPLVIFYSRAIMIEPMSMLLFLAALYYFCVWIDTGNLYIGLLATILSGIFVLIKPLYVIILFPVVVTYFLDKKGKVDQNIIRLTLFSFVAQGIFLFLWEVHTAVISSLFPNNFSYMVGGYNWYVGTMKQRFDINSYLTLFQRLSTDIVGYFGMVMLAFSFYDLIKGKGILKMWVAASALYVVIFINLNLWHDYYQLIVVPVLAILMATGLDRILKFKNLRNLVNIVIPAVFLIYAAGNWSTARQFFSLNTYYLERAGIVRQICPPQSKVAYFGNPLDVNLPDYHYLSNTQGVNVNLSQERISDRRISLLRELQGIRYFVFFDAPPKEAAHIFNELGGARILHENDVTIYRI